MIGKAEALAIVLGALPARLPAVERPLSAAQGCFLAEDALADLDMPPFPKSAVDGWAVASGEAGPGGTFSIAGRVMAGSVPARPLRSGEAMKVMTGAPVPDGADAVVMVEESTESDDGKTVRLRPGARPGQHVVARASDCRTGDRIVAKGAFLDPAALSLLAMVGKDPVAVHAPPSICVLPTGDELVRADGPPPGPGEIRETNGLMLAAQVRAASRALDPVLPGIVRDDQASLDAHLEVALGHDVVILSGGVSMGDKDLVGAALRARGMRVLIEKIAIKPGKPFLFGTVERRDGARTFVFGLPGNPVSSFVTFELFVRPFLLGLLGAPAYVPPVAWARFLGDRPIPAIPREQHVPARVVAGKDGLVALPVEWHGSADLRGLMDANALLLVPRGPTALEPGATAEVHLLSGRGLGFVPCSSRDGARA